MDRNYWEKIAPAYDTEIFDVLKNDSKGIIVSAVNQFASAQKSVIDIGCAIGKWLPVLSPAFKKVYAIDISIENLSIAKKLFPEFRFNKDNFIDKLAGTDRLRKMLPSTRDGSSYNEIIESRESEVDTFKEVRKRYLLY